MQPGIVGPEQFPIRDPRDVKLTQGRINNPPRMIELGGLDAQNKWDRKHNTSEQVSAKHEFPVEKPSKTGSVRKPDEKYDL